MKFSQDRNDALNFLQDHPLGTLSTVNENMSPELAAVYFIAHKDFTCLYVTKVGTRKFKNSNLHPQASLLSYDEELLYSVEIAGSVEVLHDTVEVAQAIEQFQEVAGARHAQYWIPPVSQLQAGQYAVCKLTPAIVHVHSYATDLQSESLPRQISFKP